MTGEGDSRFVRPRRFAGQQWIVEVLDDGTGIARELPTLRPVCLTTAATMEIVSKVCSTIDTAVSLAAATPAPWSPPPGVDQGER